MPVTGDRQVIRNLGILSNHPTAREIDQVAIASLEPLRRETAALAPRPALRRGVVARKVASRGRQRREYWVAFRRGLAMRIAHLVEFGTQPHSVKAGASVRKGIFIGHDPFHPGDHAQPFMRPAFEHTKDDVIHTFGALTWGIISTVATKMGRVPGRR